MIPNTEANTREMKGCKEEEEGDKERKEESVSCGRLLCLGLLSHGIPILLLFNYFRISSFSNKKDSLFLALRRITSQFP